MVGNPACRPRRYDMPRPTKQARSRRRSVFASQGTGVSRHNNQVASIMWRSRLLGERLDRTGHSQPEAGCCCVHVYRRVGYQGYLQATLGLGAFLFSLVATAMHASPPSLVRDVPLYSHSFPSRCSKPAPHNRPQLAFSSRSVRGFDGGS